MLRSVPHGIQQCCWRAAALVHVQSRSVSIKRRTLTLLCGASACDGSNSFQAREDPITTTTKSTDDETILDPIARFGIVSAMSKNRIIGVSGKLPWDLPEDRKHFKDLTRDKILIVGRKTYHDTPNERNIRHAQHCIVVSRSAPTNLGSDMVHVVRSFPEALHVAKQLLLDPTTTSNRQSKNGDKTDGDDDDDGGSIDCWVAGGEGIYAEALQHSSASQLHLTLVDTIVDLPQSDDGKMPSVARFPPQNIVDRYFEEASRRESETTLDESDGKPPPAASSYIVFHRRKHVLDLL